MKNKTVRPYVNYPELDKNKKVKEAMGFLWQMLFPKIGRAYWGRGSSNKVAQRELEINLNKMDWEQWNKAVIAGFNLTGKNRALFLGHSRHWAGRSLV